MSGAVAFSRTEDLVYRPAEDGLPALGYDLLVPEQRGGRELVVYLHGGGWRGGDRRLGSLPEALAAAGVTTITADYTLTGAAPYPRNIEDVFRLLEHVAARAADLDVDPARVFLTGSSSGGHLSGLAATKGLAEDRLALRPAGIIAWYAPLDPVSRYLKLRYPAEHWPGGFWARGADRPRDAKDLFTPFIGTADFSTVTLRDALDPDPRFHLDRIDPTELPPFLLLVGTRDSDEIRTAQANWHAALRSAGARAELLVVEGADHGDDDFTTPATLGAALGFIRAHSRSDHFPAEASTER